MELAAGVSRQQNNKSWLASVNIMPDIRLTI